ncbi:MAG: ribosomal protein S5-alanine N-acetyltransferase [Proteobacteria bacterium]|jgi:ribosomal-protein-alanine N-acetyltransferase|nr:ribosomal protein S5-alanine N-acetyltransferase [Pseudomonadota bacterium]MDA1300022.1 ribosomal protein S5-alanine N-acetyltransferase [Pseudomonadota bacterium]
MKVRPLPRLATERLILKLLEPSDASLMARFRRENKDHLTRWEPTRPLEFYTDGFWQMQLRVAIREFRSGSSVCLVMMDSVEQEVLGVCNYTNIVRGTFQSCHLGYALAGRHQGQGLMHEALMASNQFIFDQLELHRIMANYMPRNQRSGDLLHRLGFVIEGEARSFLKINGKWEDHVLTSMLNPAHIQSSS